MGPLDDELRRRPNWGAAMVSLGLLLYSVLNLLACTDLAAQKQPAVRILTYNTQNMFDDHKDGGEYPEFIPGGSGAWNRTAYRQRLERLAAVIRDHAQLPDIVVLQEIESQKVLDDLCADFLPSGAYPLRLLQADEGNIHLGLLSRIPLLSERSHRIWLDGESSRSIWELYFLSPGQALPKGAFNPADPGLCSFALFANHWKSKSGGEAQTEALRILAARTLRERVADLTAAWPRLDIIACGDFNEALHEVKPELPRLMAAPGKAAALKLAAQRSLAGPGSSARFALGRLDSASPDPGSIGGAELWVAPWAARNRISAAWYSPWTLEGTDSCGTPGSYYYRGNWETIDHFLFSAALADTWNWVPGRFQVVTTKELLDDQGAPQRWDSRSKQGYSDHLPLMVELLASTP